MEIEEKDGCTARQGATLLGAGAGEGAGAGARRSPGHSDRYTQCTSRKKKLIAAVSLFTLYIYIYNAKTFCSK